MSSSRRRRPCSPSAASPLDDDDLLREILLRLPPQPSSLPRTSAVCKRWRLLVSDRRFVRRFRIHHRRSPPLLGCFVEQPRALHFVPTMGSPNRVPPGRFSLQIDHGHFFQPLGCRHGLVLMSDQRRQKFLVWEPLTGDQHQIAFPRYFDWINGAVLRAAGEVHFQVFIVATGNDDTGLSAFVCVFSSETGLWGDLISTPVPLEPDSLAYLFGIIYVSSPPSVLVGDSLYWQLNDCSSISILEFDFQKQSLAVIRVPDDVFEGEDTFTVIRADGGGLGLLFVSDSSAKLWERKIDCDGVASWVLGRTIELDKLLSLDSEVQHSIKILGFAEESNMVFLWTASGFFAVQLQSLEFKKLSEFKIAASHYPFESVYTAGIDIGGEQEGGELLHNA